jgi:hypothetical protein
MKLKLKSDINTVKILTFNIYKLINNCYKKVCYINKTTLFLLHHTLLMSLNDILIMFTPSIYLKKRIKLH